jgi:AGCS family alanine or glycine:cation symporter
MILAVGLLTFAFSTILGWAYYGEKAAEYLFGTASVRWYRWVWVALVLLGSSLSLDTVWSFANVANAMMALPNLVSLLVLSGVAVAETRRYLWSGKIDDQLDRPTSGDDAGRGRS